VGFFDFSSICDFSKFVDSTRLKSLTIDSQIFTEKSLGKSNPMVQKFFAELEFPSLIELNIKTAPPLQTAMKAMLGANLVRGTNPFDEGKLETDYFEVVEKFFQTRTPSLRRLFLSR